MIRHPKPGDYVRDCRGKTVMVTAVHGGDLTFEDGTTASWVNCCEWAD